MGEETLGVPNSSSSNVPPFQPTLPVHRKLEPSTNMSSLFCCVSVKPYRPQYIEHQAKFNRFMAWATFPRDAAPKADGDQKTDLSDLKPDYAVQLVRQVNYGPLESKRYFIPVEGTDEFIEIVEDDLIQANFQKLNS